MDASMESTAHLMWSIVLGSIGLGFFIYGRKQKSAIPFVTGIGLFIVPYIIDNSYLLVTAGLALIALPYYIRL